jgi:hypothetical protein
VTMDMPRRMASAAGLCRMFFFSQVLCELE